jgi:hypothetical protein
MSVKHDDLVRSIRLFISEIGGISIDTPVRHDLLNHQGRPVMIGIPGQLDCHACIKGRFVAIDAKIGKDKFGKLQAKYADAVRRAGGIAFSAYSVDDVRDALAMEGLV